MDNVVRLLIEVKRYSWYAKSSMKRAMAVGLFLILATHAAPQTRRDFAEDEAKLLALETAWNQAETKNDFKAIGLLLADELIYIDDDGSMMSRPQFLASVKDTKLTPDRINNDGMTVRVYGDSALVTGTYHETGIDRGKRYLHRGRFTDMWIKRDGHWLCVASQTTPILNK
jgi:ketosteroid isomerase-like protein